MPGRRGGERIGFRLRSVDLGVDVDGDHVSTCVIDPGEAPAAGANRKPVRRDVALDALREAIGEHGEKMPGTSTIPPGVMAVTMEQWKGRWILRTGYDAADADSVRNNFNKDRKALLETRRIGVSSPWVWTDAK